MISGGKAVRFQKCSPGLIMTGFTLVLDESKTGMVDTTKNEFPYDRLSSSLTV